MIIVTGVLMTVDTACSVAISSLSEEECSPPQPLQLTLLLPSVAVILVSVANNYLIVKKCHDNIPTEK